MKIRRLVGVFWAWGLFSLSASPAATRYVNVSNAAPAAPYTNWSMAATSIQPAIDAATSGDEILVAPGTYLLTGNEVTIPAGKALTLRSTQSRAAIIDAQGSSLGMLVEGAGSLIEGFTLRNGSNLSFAGGGLRLMANCAIWDCLVTSNAAHSGGGIYAEADVRIENCLIASNRVGNLGGGLTLMSNGVVRSCLVTGNAALHGAGIDARGRVDIESCLIVGNRADSLGGGGLIYSGAVVQSCAVLSNSASAGGGIEIYEAGTVADCLIAGNSGGGVYFYLGTTGLVRNCVIRDNVKTNGPGGGVDVYRGGIVSNCWILNNQATGANGNGGGVWLFNETSTDLGAVVNSVVAGNHADQAGGGIWCDGPAGTLWPIVNCTIVSNTAGVNGGGAFAHKTRFINDIIYFNSAPTNANLEPHMDVLSCIISNCCTTSNYFWPNLTNAPAFVDSGAGDFRLATASFCIDAGTTNGAPRTDIDGNPRPRIGAPVVLGFSPTNCDMGAYEYGFHFNGIQAVSSNAMRFEWDVQDVGRYRLDIATNWAADPLHPVWNSVTTYTQSTIIGAGQYAVHATTVTNPVPPMPGRAIFRLSVDRATVGKRSRR